jgi:hypothetical protein
MLTFAATTLRWWKGRSMDGESFDRLSVIVHRLREKATRRGALRLLLGGSVAAAAGSLAGETEARRRRRNLRRGCKGFGGRCDSSRDCCSGRCRNGFCFPDGGGGGGNRCNGQRCPNGWDCCRFSGVDVCVPRNHPSCFNNGFCPFRWQPCGFNGPVRNCCSPETHCCHDGNRDFCLNDFFDCEDFFFDSNRSGVSSESRSAEVTEPIPVTEIDPEESE